MARPKTPKVMHVNYHGQIDALSGGANKVIRTLAKHTDRFHVTSAGLGNLRREHIFDNIRCIDFVEDAMRNLFFNKGFRMGMYTFSDLNGAIESTRPDILHFHTRPELVDQTFKRLSYRPKVIFHYHRHYIEPAVPVCASILLAISDGVRESVTEISGTRKPFEVLYNPLPEGIPTAAAMPLQHPKVPTIFFAGGRSPNKGFDELISACRLASMQGIAFKLELAGEGLETYDPPREVNAEILGYLGPEQYYRRLQQADIFIMPSKREGFGLAMLEALHFAKLAIGSNIPGLNEIIAPDHAVLFDPSQPDALAKTLIEVLRKWQMDPHQFDALRIAAHTFSRDFDPSLIASRLQDIYSLI